MAVEVNSNQYQFVDQRVTRRKFEKQVSNFEKHESKYRKEGIIRLKIDFPVFEFAFLARETLIPLPPNISNQALNIHKPVPFYLFSTKIDYSNFDIVPPSITIISPFTSEPVKNVNFVPIITPNQQDKKSLIDQKFKSINQNILLSNNKNELFICLRGIKEYHEHPQHDGDSWFLYRINGKGDILVILDQLQLYSISNFNQMISQQQKLNFNHG